MAKIVKKEVPKTTPFGGVKSLLKKPYYRSCSFLQLDTYLALHGYLIIFTQGLSNQYQTGTLAHFSPSPLISCRAAPGKQN